MNLIIKLDDPGSPDARALIARLDLYHQSLYPATSNHLLSVEELRQPNVTFVTAWLNECIAGCGAFVNVGGNYAEIKRMFVVPQLRGQKVGRRLLDALELRIRTAGLKLARLETGIWQAEALGLYEKAGYVCRGPFGDYPADPLCVFMEKNLEST